MLSIRDDLAGTDFLNWSYRIPIDAWEGITVDGSPRRVTKLIWGFKKLDGIVPPGLASLDALKQIVLNDNRLTGTIPPELGNLANLENLVLAVNLLKGPLPRELSQLAKLENFDVGQNFLTGPDSASIWQLAETKILHRRGELADRRSSQNPGKTSPPP